MFIRRRYFNCLHRHHGQNQMVDELRQAGITAWNAIEYEKAFLSLIHSTKPFLFTQFDIVCIERSGDEDAIDHIAKKYEESICEVQNPQAIDTYIDAIGVLARIPGAWILDDDDWGEHRKFEPLERLLGVERLKNYTGSIVHRTAIAVTVFVLIPATGEGLTVEIPTSSCPALQPKHAPLPNAPLLSTNDEDEQLRPYQSEQKAKILETLNRVRRVMFQMPTGTGKTRLFVSLIQDIRRQQPEARILIVAHRTELIDQISYSLTHHYQLRHGILGAKGKKVDHSILVASIQKLSRRIGEGSFDYIIIDEAHHSLAPSYKKLIDAYPQARVLGITATPYRLKRASFAELYDELVQSQPMRQFIIEGFLAHYRMFTVSDRTATMTKINRLTKFGADGDYKSQDLKDIFDTEAEIDQLYECYHQFAFNKKGIIYAVSREHAAHIATLFNNRGVAAAAIDCDTPPSERQRLIDTFKSDHGNLQVLVNVELFTEGFDCPSIEFVMLARPTRSLTLYLQQVGRALRPTPNGGDVLILDYAGLYNRFGLPDRHRDWPSHFKGIQPKNENYPQRPLGTPSVNGLMKEVERQRDAMYEKIIPTPYGWSIGHRKDGHRVDVLLNSTPKTYSFLSISEETDGTFSALRPESNDYHSFIVHFDKNLQLIPLRTVPIGNKSVVYLHESKQSGESFYTTSLALDALIYTSCALIGSNVARLKGVDNKDVIFADNQTSLLRGTETVNNIPYLITSSGCRISPTGTIYWPLHPNFPLRYTKEENGITLFDTTFTPLLHGNPLEVYDDACVLGRSAKTSLTVDYIDYLCCGVRQLHPTLAVE